MRPVQIGIVISSPSLDQCLKNIGTQKDIVLSPSYQGPEDAVPLGEKLAADGVEVLVARRGTAYWLREKLQIPVLSLPQSSLNVLRSLREAAPSTDFMSLWAEARRCDIPMNPVCYFRNWSHPKKK